MATKVKLIETGAVTGNIIPDGGIATGKLANDAVTTIKISDANITHAKLHTSMDLTGKTVTVATAAGSTNTTAAASTAFVQQELTTLIGGAPSTLNDLNELAAAINDDSNYNSTLTTALATKLPLAGGTMTGNLTVQTLVGINKAVNSSVGLSVGSDAASATSYGLEVTNNSSNTRFIVDGLGSQRFYGSDNSETARFTDGKLGIGTDNPSSKLHVKHGDIRLEGNAESGQDITFTITNDNSGNEVEAGLIRFIDTGGGQSNRGAAIASYMPTADTGDLRFYTSAGADRVERMRIYRDGNVGIGTTTPHAKLAFGGSGQIWVNNDASNPFGLDTAPGELRLFTGNANSYQMKFGKMATDGTTFTSHLTIGDDGSNRGNVGIGTSIPTAPLHVFKGESGGAANNTDSSLVLENSSHTYINFLTPASKEAGILWGDNASANTGMITYSHVTDNMSITAADDIILNADKVNIGNNKPLWSGSYGGALFLKGNNATSDRNAELTIVNSTGVSIGTGLVIDNDLQVGIGTATPASLLHVKGTQSYGSIRVSPTSTNGESAIAFFKDTAGTTTGTAWVVGHAGWGHTGDFVIGNQAFGGPIMLIEAGGNVGIGTTAPAFRFHAYHPTTNVVGRFESGDAQVWIDLHDSNSGAYGALLGHDGSAGHLFKVADASVDVKFLIKNDGNVGIGNTAPKARMHIGTLTGGNATAQEQLRLSGDYTSTNSGALLRFTNQHNSGTNPNAGEYNLAGIKAFDFRSDWGGAIALQTAPNTSYGGTLVDRLVINPEGLVGIGTAAPAHKLQVEGAIKTNPPVATGNRQRSVQTWETSFSMLGTTATNWDMTKFNEGGAGNAFLVEAFWSHYASATHSLALVAIVHTRGTAIYQQTIYNHTHSYNGSFTISAPSATTLRINKNAGTYGGTGYGCIRVTSYQP